MRDDLPDRYPEDEDEGVDLDAFFEMLEDIARKIDEDDAGRNKRKAS